ncbi:hypothetical protein EMCG_06048 [[Emmonsia] crescens]|uniref:Uncharacterized protein n=1 Tax=[Emmonsia] crescens TaxID=73230 RepID=A0A0G2IC95_9EURO|nr:hypothetical protein EMCG_06048 [Emmonsia crescens UAMH 3008]
MGDDQGVLVARMIREQPPRDGQCKRDRAEASRERPRDTGSQGPKGSGNRNLNFPGEYGEDQEPRNLGASMAVALMSVS